MATMKTLNGYGFNATELNGKTSDNYLLRTDTATNSAKLGGKAPEYYIQPRNLLDNSDFRNPVNQRGQTDYTSNGYTIDRWELYSGAVGVSSLGYITTSGQMYQKIAIPTDKVYTFAIKNDAGIALVTGIPANGIHSATLGNALIKLATIDEYVEVVIEPSEGYNLAGAYWAALYEGSYTAETLPPYVPKGYATELAECRRYFRRIPSYTTINAIYIYSTYARGALQFEPMRIVNPSVIINGQCDYLPPGGNWTSFTPSGLDSAGNSIIITHDAAQSATAGYACFMRASLDISADL